MEINITDIGGTRPSRIKNFEFDITPAAIEKVKSLVDENSSLIGLRVAVKAGGCSGFQYEFQPLEQTESTDYVLDMGTVTFAIDEHSAHKLYGCTLDYEKTLMIEQFIVNNPNAANSCGCGVSFTV